MAAPATQQPPPDASLEAHRLVHRFLLNHGYSEAATAFEREATRANHRFSNATRNPGEAGHDLQDVVDDWIANRLARCKIDDPSITLKDQLDQLELDPEELPRDDAVQVRTAIRDASNVLSVKRAFVPRREWDSQQLGFVSHDLPCLLTTAVDRTLKVYRSDSFDLVDSYDLPSPALSIAQHPEARNARLVACATMEGSLSVIDLVSRQVVARVKDHTKYIVRIAFSPNGEYLASLGYDKLIHIYRVTVAGPTSSLPQSPALEDDDPSDPLAETPQVELQLVHTIHTRTNPEAAIWLPEQPGREGEQWLVWTAREDNLLHYVKAPSQDEPVHQKWETEEWNLNENGDSFISFSVLSITLHPTLPLLSLQTSTASARILLYPFHSATRILTLHTTASQSDYFNPRHAWLPSGAAVVVNSEDGIVRLVDLQGKVRLSRGAHGVAAPDEELLSSDAAGGQVSQEVRSERARLRREADRGSSVVRDVEVLVPQEDDKGVVSTKGWRLVSCGYDKTVKVLG